MRASICMASTTGPANSITLSVAPLTVSLPMTARITSLAKTPGRSLPVRFTLIVSGSRIVHTPLRMPTSRSVVPTPAANAPNAPWVQVCESPMMTVKPGRTNPFSGKSAWQTPFAPMSKKSLMPCRLAQSRIVLPCSAVLESFAGVTWSMTALIFVGSNTRSLPMATRSLMAIGVVISWQKTRSRLRTQTPSAGLSTTCASKIF